MSTSDVVKMLDALPRPEWHDLSAVDVRNRDTLSQIANDKDALRGLVERTLASDALRSMCERDHFRLKYVLYDGGERQFRLRLHIWNDAVVETVHDHRFAYTSKILRGSYRHFVFSRPQDIYPEALENEEQREWDATDSLAADSINIEEIKLLAAFKLSRGESYTQAPGLLSSTVVEPNTVSLFIRGPAQRDRAFQWDRDSNTLIWRRGAAHSNKQDRESLVASNPELRAGLRKLEWLDVLNPAASRKGDASWESTVIPGSA